MQDLQIQYANYLLSFEWDAYYTQTFKRLRHDSTNAVNACWHILENRLEWTRGFMAVESHRLGGIHLHCLLSNDLIDYSNPIRAKAELSLRLSNTKKYCDKAFGFTHITTANNQATVNLYCAKYVTKGNGDYFFMGHW